MKRTARHSSDHPAVLDVEGGRSLRTYAELDRDADAAAAWLARSTTPGDLVAMRLAPGPEAFALIHGAWRAGCVLAPLNPAWTPPEVTQALAALGSPSLVVDGDDPAPWVRSPSGVATTGRDRTPGQAAVRVALCTSGTSGIPRVVRLTEENLAASAAAVAEHLLLTAEDRWLASLSLAHVGGFALVHRAAAVGAAVIPLRSFDAMRVASLLETGLATHVSLVPTMLRRVLEVRGTEAAPPTLRCVLVGGAPCPRALVDRALELGYPVGLTYGLTEAASQVATAGPDLVRRKRGTVGPALPGVELRIDVSRSIPSAPPPPTAAPDPGDGEAADAGEILVRGATVCPEARSSDGWLHTGDVGALDSDGDLHVLGRMTDTIISGGVSVHPAEIESVLATHPAVAEVAVTAIADEHWGEVVLAVVVARSGGEPPTLADLLEFSRHRLAPAKRPRGLRVVAELPRNANGKVDRSRLAADDPGRGGQASPPAPPS